MQSPNRPVLPQTHRSRPISYYLITRFAGNLLNLQTFHYERNCIAKPVENDIRNSGVRDLLQRPTQSFLKMHEIVICPAKVLGVDQIYVFLTILCNRVARNHERPCLVYSIFK